MKKICLYLISNLVLAYSFACANPLTIELKNGFIIAWDNPNETIPHGHRFNVKGLDQALQQMERLWKKTKNIDYYSDYGLVLLLQKKYTQAIDVYMDIEKRSPNRYATAANLGTIYDLLGENKKAIVWIQNAIKMNPASHAHSEWLHVKILEAKIKGEAFMTGKFLLNVDFGNDSIPSSTLSQQALVNLRKAIFFQLNERISFVKPVDKTIATLLFELGNIARLTDKKAEACDIFEKAKLYGCTNPLLPLRYACVKRYKTIWKY